MINDARRALLTSQDHQSAAAVLDHVFKLARRLGRITRP
jgi:hypothetical protein